MALRKSNTTLSSYAQDPESLKKRTDYASNILFDMLTQEEQAIASEVMNIEFK